MARTSEQIAQIAHGRRAFDLNEFKDHDAFSECFAAYYDVSTDFRHLVCIPVSSARRQIESGASSLRDGGSNGFVVSSARICSPAAQLRRQRGPALRAPDRCTDTQEAMFAHFENDRLKKFGQRHLVHERVSQLRELESDVVRVCVQHQLPCGALAENAHHFALTKISPPGQPLLVILNRDGISLSLIF